MVVLDSRTTSPFNSGFGNTKAVRGLLKDKMEAALDITDCLERWNRGDKSAADELIQHVHPIVSRIARHHRPKCDHEDEVIQEVLIKMFSRLHQYQGDAPLTHWVARLAVTTCFDRVRAQKRHREICWTDLTPEESDVLDPDWLGFAIPDASATIQARDLVDRLLSSLTPGDRSLILQIVLEGLSLEEISKRLGWGISKIKVHVFRMRAHLRETLQNLEQDR